MPNFSAIVGHQRLKRYSRNEKRSFEVFKVINRDEHVGSACEAIRALTAAEYNTCNLDNQ